LGNPFLQERVPQTPPKELSFLSSFSSIWYVGIKYAIVPVMSVSLANGLLRETPPNYGGKNRIPEHLLASLWKKKAARQEWLRTSGGTRVRVIYPGMAGTGAGPDFRDALLEIEGEGLVRGDVEIHVRQKDWKSHGHGGDPNYNGVVLHAALEVESQDTRLQSGSFAPVVPLEPLLDAETRQGQGLVDSANDQLDLGNNAGLWAVLNQSGYPAPSSPDEMGELLDSAGDHRFWAKKEYFSLLLREQSPEQTLYETLMEGLGYRRNQQPFLKLASRASYAALVRGARGLSREARPGTLADWLLQLSGLSSGEPQAYQTLPRMGFGAPLVPKEWHCFRLRPSNHPRRRIRGAAVLLDRFLDQGLVAGLAGACGSGNAKKLLAALSVPAQNSQEGNGQPALIGKDRASDLAVNVVLPFFHALDGLYPGRVPCGDPLGFYRSFGKLQGNELIREMTQQLFDPSWDVNGSSKIINSARRQQGLLRLHAVLIGAS